MATLQPNESCFVSKPRIVEHLHSGHSPSPASKLGDPAIDREKRRTHGRAAILKFCTRIQVNPTSLSFVSKPRRVEHFHSGHSPSPASKLGYPAIDREREEHMGGRPF